VHEVLLKEKMFLGCENPSGLYMGLSNLLKLRTQARQFLCYEVGDGRSIFLGLNRWQPDDIWHHTYGHRIFYDATTLLMPRWIISS
jgi:hypothetical protein